MKFSLSTFIYPLLTQCIGLSDAKGYNSEDVLIRGRLLSYNRLWVYEPLTLVTDHVSNLSPFTEESGTSNFSNTRTLPSLGGH